MGVPPNKALESGAARPRTGLVAALRRQAGRLALALGGRHSNPEGVELSAPRDNLLVIPFVSGCLSLVVLAVAFAAGASAARGLGWAPVFFGMAALLPLGQCWSAYRLWRDAPTRPGFWVMILACGVLLVPASLMEWEVVRMEQPYPPIRVLTSIWWLSIVLSFPVTIRVRLQNAIQARDAGK